MSLLNRKEPLILFGGDLCSFIVALWLSLLVRNLEVPSKELFLEHLAPFSLLFVVWVFVFYIAGLYAKHTTILKSRLPGTLASAQLVNSGLAVVFFYLIPFFGITPKTVLFIYLLVSFALTLLWRVRGYLLLSRGEANRAVLVSSGKEMKELLEEVNSNPIYNIKFVFSVDLGRADEKGFWDEIVPRIYSENISVAVIDFSNKSIDPVLPHFYNLMFSKINFVDMHKVYEEIFDRIPLSLLKYDWFLENISTSSRDGYHILKRLMDIAISLPLFIVSLAFYPLVFLAIKLEDGGPIFIRQDRVGGGNRLVKIIKFRSMTANDDGHYDGGSSTLKVTKVGAFLRKSRLDEFPQLWNVVSGDLSLIGPRPELPSLVKHYSREIPYYGVRHLIKPGLSGWAQILHDGHPHHGVDISETAKKLSYDLYYIKNRSFLLDIKIALRTLKTLLSVAGR